MTISTAIPPSNAARNPASDTSSSSKTATTQGTVDSGLTTIANNFQSFLSLLTTQLKNQDPTSPLDTNQFTQQITQMTGVQQQLVSNQLLQQLVSQQGGLTAAANLIGKQITATGAAKGDPNITGVVTAVQQADDGSTVLTVGSQQVPMTSVTGIAENPSNPLAALIGG